MTYADEDVRHAFHALPTQTQFEWTRWDEDLARTGYVLHVEHVSNTRDYLQVTIRVDKKLERSGSSISETPVLDHIG